VRQGIERIVRPAATLDYAVAMVAGPGERHADRYAARLLATLLGDSSGSRLYWSLVDTGEAEHASLQHHDFLDAGLFVTQLSCEAADVEPLLRRIAGVYGEARTAIGTAEFERARNKLASRVVLGGEKPLRRLFDLGLEWSHSRTYRSIAETLRRVESLERGDIDRVLHEWPLDGPAATVIAGRG
jgi:predicted Zn-dependent peptidase